MLPDVQRADFSYRREVAACWKSIRWRFLVYVHWLYIAYFGRGLVRGVCYNWRVQRYAQRMHEPADSASSAELRSCPAAGLPQYVRWLHFSDSSSSVAYGYARLLLIYVYVL